MPSKDEVDNAIIAGSNASIIGAVAGIANNAQLRDLNRQAAYQNETLQQIADQSAAQLQAINQQTLMQSQAFAEIKAKVDAGNEIQKQQLSVIQDAAEAMKRKAFADWLAINPNGQFYAVWEKQAKRQLAMILDASEMFNQAYLKGLKRQALQVAAHDKQVLRINDPERMQPFVAPPRQSPKPTKSGARTAFETLVQAISVTTLLFSVIGAVVLFSRFILWKAIPYVTEFFSNYFLWIVVVAIVSTCLYAFLDKPLPDPEYDRIQTLKKEWYKTHYTSTAERDKALETRFKTIYAEVEQQTKLRPFAWCVDRDIEAYIRQIMATMDKVYDHYLPKEQIPPLRTLVVDCFDYSGIGEINAALLSAASEISIKYKLPIDIVQNAKIKD